MVEVAAIVEAADKLTRYRFAWQPSPSSNDRNPSLRQRADSRPWITYRNTSGDRSGETPCPADAQGNAYRDAASGEVERRADLARDLFGSHL